MNGYQTYDIEPDAFHFSRHAVQRLAQRNLAPADIFFVVQHASEIHRAGAIFYHLRRRDIPHRLRREKRFSRLEGTTVVLNQDDRAVITVYRNRARGLRAIKQKRNYDASMSLSVHCHA